MPPERYWNSNYTRRGNYNVEYTKGKRLSAKEQVEEIERERLLMALWVIETYFKRK
jgi:hypothetical protein